MNFNPPQTIEQQNIKAQLDLWQQQTKYLSRQIALESALKIKLDNGGDLLRNADEIYQWLVKDIAQYEKENPQL